MDEYIDDDFEEKKWKKKQGRKKKLVTNPKGPFHFDMTFKGIEYDIVIENITYDKFKVCAICKEEEEKNIEEIESEMLILQRYLEDEGFFLAARKHNLYYN